MSTEDQILISLTRLETQHEALGRDVRDIKGAIVRLEERTDETHDLAVLASGVSSASKKSAALSGAGASGALLAAFELFKGFLA